MIHLSGGTLTTLHEGSRELDHGPASAVKTIDAIVVAQGRAVGGYWHTLPHRQGMSQNVLTKGDHRALLLNTFS